MRFLTEKYEVCILEQPVILETVNYAFSPSFLYRNLLCQERFFFRYTLGEMLYFLLKTLEKYRPS